MRIGRHGFQQILNQETVHLKKRKWLTRYLYPRPRASNTGPSIQNDSSSGQQSKLSIRQSFPERGRQLLRRLWEFLERHVQRNLFVGGVRQNASIFLDALRNLPERAIS